MARRRIFSFLFLLLTAAAFAGFVSLGVWQLQRLDWKENLIARVEARVHAEPVAIPSQDAWAAVSRDDHEYRRVTLTGQYHPEATALVSAATEKGQGYWLMVPLQRRNGSWVYINRGFVPTAQRAAALAGRFRPAGEVEVSGLLRMNEPKGGVLRENRPDDGRWYSRDVVAMATRHQLAPVAPFFVDAERQGDGVPHGGLTVIRFRNNHQVYALTWFALALGTVVAVVLVIREGRRRAG